MPKEQIRKRGKRKPKAEEEPIDAPKVEVQAPAPIAEPVREAGPSGLHPDRIALLAGGHKPFRAPPRTADGAVGTAEGGNGEVQEGEQAQGLSGRVFGLNEEFPFGELDPDTKGYFKGLDEKIKSWQESGTSNVAIGEEREDRQNDLKDALDSLRGKELKISTDPDTSITLERLLPSLGDWGRRVVGDSFGTQWELLLKNRFGSHIVQTWLTLAADTLDREARGVFPPQQEEQNEEVGVLPTMGELVKGLVSSIEANLAFMLANPFASPVVRLLWLVLSPGRALPDLDEKGVEGIRSKRSNKYRKGQGVQGKSIFGDEVEKGKGAGRKFDETLAGLRKDMRVGLMGKLSGAEWRMLGVNAVGCVAVQLLLEFEVEDGDHETENSLLDHLTEGLITNQIQSIPYTPQPYPLSLLASSTGTRLFETLLLHTPLPIFSKLWEVYFEGKIGKLAIHPMSNFVVAKGVERLDKEGVERVVGECKAVQGGRGMIKSARTSVLQALVERVTKMGDCQLSVLGLISSAISLPEKDKNLVPCLMTLNTHPRYTSIASGEAPPDEEDLPEEVIDKQAEDEAAAAAKVSAWENRRKIPKVTMDGAIVGLEPKIQGCLLLQSLAQCPEANEVVLQSLIDQPTETLIAYSTNPIASRLLDIVLTHPSIPTKYRRRLISTLTPHLEDLLADKIGSRVTERVWESADGYTKEKIAKTLVKSSESIRRSQYGRYLWPKLKLDIMMRRPDQWRAEAIGVKHHFAHQKEAVNSAPAAAVEDQEEASEEQEDKKRKTDDIDELFEGVVEKKKKKSKKDRA